MASTRIKIAGRLRPKIQGEIEDDTVAVQRDPDGSSYFTVIHPRDNSQRFKFPFASCYDRDSTQQEIYENDVKPLIDTVYTGVTVTVFAYGVTSSGKTHTIQGSRADPGVIPRAIKDMFRRKEQVQGVSSALFVSYMEIYKEEVYDLLVDRDSAPKLPVRENECGQVFVANLSHQEIESVQEFERLYSAASKRRSTGATNFNRASSRSHAILTISVQMDDPTANHTVLGKLNLVDLAGSENNKFTGNDPSRMAESAAINKSLSVLGQVVHALNQGHSRIPYRNSKLTRILQDALGGSAVGLLICNLAPGAKFRQDTWNTLNFATRTKEIENKPVVNVKNNDPPKVHFAALAPPPPKLPSAQLPQFAPSTLSALPEYSCTDSDNSTDSAPGLLHGNHDSGTMRARRRGPRPSLIPGPSSVPAGSGAGSGAGFGSLKGRVSSAFGIGANLGMGMFGGGGGSAFQSFGALGAPAAAGPSSSSSSGAGNSNIGSSKFKPALAITEEEIDERIARAVEAEVARRMGAREKELEREREELLVQKQLFAETSAHAQAQAQLQVLARFSPPPAIPQQYDLSTASAHSLVNQSQHPAQLPSGILTPLLKRHQDLDNELKARLTELEQKYERDNKEAQLAEVLSPVSKKKTGRAYVALARAHSEKGNLEVALDLYRRAESYVPDNAKLKERILEIEYAVKNGLEFKQEPKRKKSSKDKSRANKHSENADASTADDVEEEGNEDDDAPDTDGIAERVRQRRRGPFGEATNGGTGTVVVVVTSPSKRGATTPGPTDVDFVASPKKRKTDVVSSFADGGENVHEHDEDVDDFGVKYARAVSGSGSPNKRSSPTKRSRSQSQLSPRKRQLSVSPTKRSVSAGSGAGAVPHIVFGNA